MKTVIIELQDCQFDRKNRVLRIPYEKVDHAPGCKYVVRSHHTGKEIEFKHIGPEHRLWNEDHWDGEMSVYEPMTPILNVEVMVIYHG